jgi:hypothetical protein
MRERARFSRLRNDPTIAIVEPHTVFSGRQGMKLNHGLIIFDDDMLHMKLSSLCQYPVQFAEGAGNNVGLAVVIPRKKVSAHHGLIDVIGHMSNKGHAVAVFETFENFTNLVSCDCHRIFPLLGY